MTSLSSSFSNWTLRRSSPGCSSVTTALTLSLLRRPRYIGLVFFCLGSCGVAILLLSVVDVVIPSVVVVVTTTIHPVGAGARAGVFSTVTVIPGVHDYC